MRPAADVDHDLLAAAEERGLVVVMGSTDIARWRSSTRPGHTRFVAPPALRPGGRGEPDERLSPVGAGDMVDGDSVRPAVPSLGGGIEEPRRATERYMGMIAGWARAHPEFMLERARYLKQESPLQFAHMTDIQLAAELTRIVEEKAKAAVELTYNRRGWSRKLDLDLVPTGDRNYAPASLLVGGG